MKGSGPGGPDRPERPGARKQDWIGSQLRRIYDDALQEEIPPEMMALLEKLDKKPEGESGA
jgi:Anti-sigma factor NepR